MRLKRGGGDPLLMARFGTEPPRVPRRAKILADVWDQQSFDQDAPEHVLSVAVPAGGGLEVAAVDDAAAHTALPKKKNMRERILASQRGSAGRIG